MCIPESFSLSCVCMPCSPFQNSETWLMLQGLFPHIYLTTSIEGEKAPQNSELVSPNKRFEKHYPPVEDYGKIYEKNRIFRKIKVIVPVVDKIKLKNHPENHQNNDKEKIPQST